MTRVVRMDVSREAARKRLVRLFTPRSNGTYAVDDSLVNLWKDLKNRDEMLEEFAKSGFDKAW